MSLKYITWPIWRYLGSQLSLIIAFCFAESRELVYPSRNNACSAYQDGRYSPTHQPPGVLYSLSIPLRAITQNSSWDHVESKVRHVPAIISIWMKRDTRRLGSSHRFQGCVLILTIHRRASRRTAVHRPGPPRSDHSSCGDRSVRVRRAECTDCTRISRTCTGISSSCNIHQVPEVPSPTCSCDSLVCPFARRVLRIFYFSQKSQEVLILYRNLWKKSPVRSQTNLQLKEKKKDFLEMRFECRRYGGINQSLKAVGPDATFCP